MYLLSTIFTKGTNKRKSITYGQLVSTPNLLKPYIERQPAQNQRNFATENLI